MGVTGGNVPLHPALYKTHTMQRRYNLSMHEPSRFCPWLLICIVSIGGIVTGAEPVMQPAVATLPASRGGQDLVGTTFPALSLDRWLNTDGNRQPELSHRVTLYRWWTDTCPFCARTLPAIEKLRQEFEPQGLKVVAVYHPKPPREVKDAEVIEAASASATTVRSRSIRVGRHCGNSGLRPDIAMPPVPHSWSIGRASFDSYIRAWSFFHRTIHAMPGPIRTTR